MPTNPTPSRDPHSPENVAIDHELRLRDLENDRPLLMHLMRSLADATGFQLKTTKQGGGVVKCEWVAKEERRIVTL